MSGGYAHITIAQLATEEAIYRRGDLLPTEAKQALGFLKKFTIVGALAPDYPYLDIEIIGSESADWADRVHKAKGVDLLRAGAAAVRVQANDNTRRKCVAWLFGFASHVVTDGTIHPVVNLKVGPYEANKTAHRVCEMNQDVYAHRRLNLGALNFNQQISRNVKSAADPTNADRFDPAVAELWRTMLVSVYPDNPTPKIDDWHRGMRRMMDLAERSDRLIPFARHIAANKGLVYPDTIDPQYINGLQTPANAAMDYEAIFNKALANVVEMWGWLALSLQGKSSPLDSMKSWSLDTGIDENNRMVYWS
jgi:hypothetical protein